MRFRATIDNVATFARIMQTVERLQKKCIIKFGETEMRIICNTDESGVQIWSTIRTNALFVDYRIQSNANNEISLALAADALSHVLRALAFPPSSSSSNHRSTSAAAATHAADAQRPLGGGGDGGGGGMDGRDEVVMKLAKKNDVPVLNLELFASSRASGRRVRVSHDVRIDILKPADVARLKEPMCPEPDVHVLLPPLNSVRTLVERLRALTDVVAVRANRSGRLQLAAATESARVAVAWTGLTNPRTDGPEDAQEHDPRRHHQQQQRGQDAERERGEGEEEGALGGRDREKMFGVLVRTRSLLKFLNAHLVSTTTIGCVCHQHCMIFYVYVGEVAEAGGVLTYYLPAVMDD